METIGWLSILPPVVAIAMAIKTREVYISLAVFVWLGWTIMNSWNPIVGLVDGVNPGLVPAIVFVLACLMASATDHIDHVRTRLPYALLAAAGALVLVPGCGLRAVASVDPAATPARPPACAP